MEAGPIHVSIRRKTGGFCHHVLDNVHGFLETPKFAQCIEVV